MNQLTIKAILDEEDGTPVFELSDGEGFATNAVTMSDALDFINRFIKPMKTLEDIARNWITNHGTNVYEGIYADIILDNAPLHLSEENLDSIVNMIEHAKITIEFPYGYGTPCPIEGA